MMKTRKKKILHVYKDFNVFNGLTEILTILAQTIDQDKYELSVCVFRYEGNSFGRTFEELGGRIHCLNIPDRLYNQPREIYSLYRFFKKYRPDIVQTHVLKANLYGVLAARMAKVPAIIATEMTLKDTAPSRTGRIRDRLLHPVLVQILKHCDQFMVTSEFIRNEWYDDRFREKFNLIYPPFNLNKYEIARADSGDLQLPEGPRIGYVGRLSEEKGVRFLISALPRILQQIPDAKLVLAGTGPLERELMSSVDRSGLRDSVVFLGYVSNVFEVLKHMDVFVLPSRSEGCPISVIEAMAMELPVVATGVGGTPELVKDGESGILVPFNDIGSIGDAVVEALRDRRSTNALGKRGRDRAFTRFHQKTFTGSLESMYERLLEPGT